MDDTSIANGYHPWHGGTMFAQIDPVPVPHGEQNIGSDVRHQRTLQGLAGDVKWRHKLTRITITQQRFLCGSMNSGCS